MKLFFRIAQLIIIPGLVSASCSPLAVSPEPNATDTLVPILMTSTIATLPPESIGNPPLFLPDMYFVIDESESMILNDLGKKGGACDASGLRYAIPLLIAQTIKSLSDQGAANVPNIYLLLKDEQEKAEIPFSVSPDQMIDILQKRQLNPQRGYVQPFDALQAVFGVAKINDHVFLFTDGDFRKNRPDDDPYNSDADKTSVKVADMFEDKHTDLKNFTFLLCTRRLESQKNRFIKRAWEDIAEDQQSIVYGLDLPDLQDEMILDDTISKMFLDWLGDWGGESKNGYVSHGWGWLANENISSVNNVTPELLRLRYGSISFDKGILAMQAQVDGVPVPELDNVFFEYVDDFIPPTEQCGPHYLEFDQSTQVAHSFYWWWADTPRVYVESDQPLLLYNNNSYEYKPIITVSSSLNNEFLKSINGNNDLNEFSRCLRFNMTIDGDKNYPLGYVGDGGLLLGNVSNPFSHAKDPLPNNATGDVSVTFWRTWNFNQDLLFSTRLLSKSQNTQMAKIRYYPAVGNRMYDQTSQTSSKSQGIFLKIPLDFFEEKYYPSSDKFPESNWQPEVSFSGDNCPLGLVTPVRPPYQPSGGQSPSFDVKKIRVGDSALEITINIDESEKIRNCQKLILSWDHWASDIEYWQAPPKIELICNFESVFECK